MDAIRVTAPTIRLGDASNNQSSDHSRPSKPKFKRGYKACIQCRRTKTKCELLPANDGPSVQPSCIKCRRERRVCEFTPTRSIMREKMKISLSKNAKSLPNEAHATTGGENFANNSEMDGDPRQEAIASTPALIDTTSFPGSSPPGYQGDSNTGGSLSSASASPSRSIEESGQRRQSMSQTLMRTIVSSSNDALGLLFKAVEQPIDSGDQDGIHQEEIANPGFNDADNIQSTQNSVQHETPYSTTPGPPPLYQLSVVSQDVLQLWNRCRFVKQGWLSAREAVTYVDLFFKNCAPYSPIITDYYSSHSNHLTLVTEETLLCCTILSISSRVHILPGLGGIARGHFIHGCLWGHLEHLISRVIFGQEKISTAKTRTLGTIESFLLMTEWHPRSLHFPPKSEGWDCALLAAPDAPESIETQEAEEHSALYRWREEVFEPAKRSDRMSWMLVGAATTLAHELGIFSDQDAFSSVSDENNVSKVRRMRVRMLLYVYVNQLAMRLGCTTLLPETNPSLMCDRSPSLLMTTQVQQWQTIMSCWYEMTKLMETVTDMCFPSADITRQLLLSGRYNSLLNHFQPLIKQIYAKANELEGISDSMHDLLFIEYHYIRLYINSIAIQAVVERAQAQDIAGDSSSTRKGVFFTNVSRSDRAFNAEVIDAACQILRKTVHLSKAGTLCYAPVRIYLRVISASIFLLKAISLGVGNHDLQVSLGVLDECIQALQNNQRLDEMHLSARYGTLLARHVKRFRANFVTSLSRDGQLGNSSALQGMNNLAVNQQAYLPASQVGGGNVNSFLFNHLQNTRLNPPLEPRGEDRGFLDDWLVQPFDPGIAPFELGGPQFQSGFEIGSLDFLWNMPS